jgi:hypothetical protein
MAFIGKGFSSFQKKKVIFSVESRRIYRDKKKSKHRIENIPKVDNHPRFYISQR